MHLLDFVLCMHIYPSCLALAADYMFHQVEIIFFICFISLDMFLYLYFFLKKGKRFVMPVLTPKYCCPQYPLRFLSMYRCLL
uniref:Uncharacterized protein n=1 Tax=Arundo donax TaxID=35708 RepID=A0A0A8Z5C6_ARUDO